MKKLIITSFTFLLLLTGVATQADTSLDISNWDFDAISTSRTVYSNNEKELKPFTEIDREKLAGSALYSTDGRFAYITSRDGWISKYDLQTHRLAIKVRVGIESANSALSSDDRIIITGNRQPADLVLLDTEDLSVLRIIPVQTRKGIMSPVAAVRDGGEEHGFIVAPQNIPKIWKVNYLNPPPIGFGDGWNHDYRCLKEHVDKPLFPIKRLKIGQTLSDFHIDKQNIFLVGTNTDEKGIIMDLDLSRVVAHPEISAVTSGLIWKSDQASRLAVLNKDKASLSIYSNATNPRKWETIKSIPINPATAIASCGQSAVIWIGGENGKLQLIDKQSLKTKQIETTHKGRIKQISCVNKGSHTLLDIGLGNEERVQLIYDSQTLKLVSEEMITF